MTPDRVEGLLAVDKPAGPTSHDVVLAARRGLGVRRIGHTGTLDPFASGLLLLLVGRATRLAEYFADLPKRYLATARLGQETDTEDPTGHIVRETDAWRELDPQRVRAVFAAMVGERLQRPPAYSAKKLDGRRAYTAARSGASVALEPVPIRIDALRVTAVDLPLVEFEITCSTGTYVRSIARDAGADLGVWAHLVSLRRTAIGSWLADDAACMEPFDGDGARTHLVGAWDALAHRERIVVAPEAAARVRHGMIVPIPAGAPGFGGEAVEGVAVGCLGELVAMADLRDGRIHPRKVFHE